MLVTLAVLDDTVLDEFLLNFVMPSNFLDDQIDDELLKLDSASTREQTIRHSQKFQAFLEKFVETEPFETFEVAKLNSYLRRFYFSLKTVKGEFTVKVR